jgi:hypothetical protein
MKLTLKSRPLRLSTRLVSEKTVVTPLAVMEIWGSFGPEMSLVSKLKLAARVGSPWLFWVRTRSWPGSSVTPPPEKSQPTDAGVYIIVPIVTRTSVMVMGAASARADAPKSRRPALNSVPSLNLIRCIVTSSDTKPIDLAMA